jgi:hypothetical protein
MIPARQSKLAWALTIVGNTELKLVPEFGVPPFSRKETNLNIPSEGGTPKQKFGHYRFETGFDLRWALPQKSDLALW